VDPSPALGSSCFSPVIAQPLQVLQRGCVVHRVDRALSVELWIEDVETRQKFGGERHKHTQSALDAALVGFLDSFQTEYCDYLCCFERRPCVRHGEVRLCWDRAKRIFVDGRETFDKIEVA